MNSKQSFCKNLSNSGLRTSAVRFPRRGQSLIEAMVAISLLTTGFLGLVALLSRSFFLNRVVSDETTANYLASEGIEIAKNLIDHDVYLNLAGVPGAAGWGTCFDSQGFNPDEVELDYSTTDCKGLAPFSPTDFLEFDPVTGLYGYNLPAGDGPVATNFTREIVVDRVGDQMTVDAIVNWSTGPVTSQTIDLQDIFYNWHL